MTIKKKVDHKVKLFNVNLSSRTFDEVLSTLLRAVEVGGKKDLWWVNTPNSEQIVMAREDDTFRSCLNSSSLSLPDGIGVVWAAKLLSYSKSELKGIKERISGVDMMERLIEKAAKKGKKVFLLGGRGQVSELVAQKLETKFKGLRVDYWPGAQEIERETKKERKEALERIRKAKTDLLFVAFGAPLQEKWVKRNLKDLKKAGVKVVMVVGGAFDIVSGNIKRAPKIMRELGLEWLFRLLMEPWRVKRQLRLIKFMGMTVKALVKQN